MGSLLYQGHGSFRIITEDNIVIYVDPFAGEGYDIPADVILVTHQHRDHNQIQLVPQKEECVIIQNFDALIDGEYQKFNIKNIRIEAVPAYNKNHDKAKCVGYLLYLDGKSIYASGDTSKTKEMEQLAALSIDYAFYPIDGIYNMEVKEAMECAKLVGAKHSIPIHIKPGELYSEQMAKEFSVEGSLLVKPSETIELV